MATEPTPAEADPSIRIRGLRSQFGDHVVHQNLDLDVDAGRVLGVVGGSGAGKSVLLRSILGLKRPEAGEITVLGVNLAEASEEALHAVQKRWGVLFQSGALWSNLTVLENVEAPLREHSGMTPQDIREVAHLRITMAGLNASAAHLKPSELSGGMIKRAALARTLALDPELLFLDEPTSGLDPLAAGAFDELILDLSRVLGLTVFMITHDLDSLYAITDEVAVIADQRVVAKATVDELERSEHPWIKSYFRGPRGRAGARRKE